MNLKDTDFALTKIASAMEMHLTLNEGEANPELTFKLVGWAGGTSSEPHTPIVAALNDDGEEMFRFTLSAL